MPISTRDNYPALRNQTYLNTASCGVMSRSTAEAAQGLYQALVEQGGRSRNDWYEQIGKIRREVAHWISAQSEEVALLPNFSIASNYITAALSDFPRVLLLNSDYSSLTMPWLLHGHALHYFEAEANGSFDLNHIEQKVEEHSINVLVVSHVQYDTGFCADLETLGQWCRNQGVILVVDATQSLGVVPIDVQRIPVDILIGSGYKWIGAGFGNALLYVRQELHERLTVPAVGNNSFDGFPRIRTQDDLHFSPRLLEVGHYDFNSLFALRQAVRALETIGAAAIYQRVQALNRYLYDRLPASVRVVSDYPEGSRSGITVIEGDLALESKLLEHEIVTSARARGLRISLHHYNNEADIDRLCEALTKIL